MNLNPRKEFLQPIRTTERAQELGRKGGIRSGQTRRRKAILRQQLNAYMYLSDYIDTLSDAEYKEFLQEYTEAEQERIQFLFKPTPKQQKQLFKTFI